MLGKEKNSRERKGKRKQDKKNEGYLGIEDRESRKGQKVPENPLSLPHTHTCMHAGARAHMLHRFIHTLNVLLTHITPKLNTATPGKTQREMQRETERRRRCEAACELRSCGKSQS